MNVIHKVFKLDWQTLSRLGQNNTIKSSYFWFVLVPTAAKILEKIQFNIELPFSWKAFYFASVFFALATFIYAAFCPLLIKRYSNYVEFKKNSSGAIELFEHMKSAIILPQDQSEQWTRNNRNQLYRLIKFIDRFAEVPLTETEKTHLKKNPPQGTGVLNKNFTIGESNLCEAYHYIVGKKTFERPVLRELCTLLYYIGFFLIGWVLLDNFSSVLCSLDFTIKFEPTDLLDSFANFCR